MHLCKMLRSEEHRCLLQVNSVQRRAVTRWMDTRRFPWIWRERGLSAAACWLCGESFIESHGNGESHQFARGHVQSESGAAVSARPDRLMLRLFLSKSSSETWRNVHLLASFHKHTRSSIDTADITYGRPGSVSLRSAALRRYGRLHQTGSGPRIWDVNHSQPHHLCFLQWHVIRIISNGRR